MGSVEQLSHRLQALSEQQLSPLDILPEGNLAERVLSLLFDGIPPEAPARVSAGFADVIRRIGEVRTSDLRLVVFGGGTGLSNIIGGDSRRKEWPDNPFSGLKELFPRCHSIVCITDDGGSTGELLKDVPLVALGDIRHVLLSSIQRSGLERAFGLDFEEAERLARALHALFNYRFITCPEGPDSLLRDTGAELLDIPEQLLSLLLELLELLFIDPRLQRTLHRPQCLGNLILAAAVFQRLDPSLDNLELSASHQLVRTATSLGLAGLCRALGMSSRAVLPCTTTSSRLRMRYGNGVQVTGEHKSGSSRRGCPVDRITVEFCHEPYLQPELVSLVAEADILLFAPGSLYSSIIPIMQVPGIAEAIRDNTRALKLLITNIWVQKGETDAARDAPNRKFHVSDLIQAYHRNIPGGVQGLFSHVLPLDLADIPGSILQRYALEDKEPIYLDRHRVHELGFSVVAVPFFSRTQLRQRGIIQHDAGSLALAVRALYGLRRAGVLPGNDRPVSLAPAGFFPPCIDPDHQVPCRRYEAIESCCRYMRAEHVTSSSGADEELTGRDRHWLMSRVVEIIWNHPDIRLEHLRNVRGVSLVDPAAWKRCQQWDNVFSFYDPQDQRIRIRQDQTEDLKRFEVAFLIALGQALLGNYALSREMRDITEQGTVIGRIYNLRVREPDQLDCFFDARALEEYLVLARMNPSPDRPGLFTRVINGSEGFTPPGLLFGLFYAWYLDNRFAPHIEYKMSIMKNERSDLIPEQVRIVRRRQRLIRFFRNRVFLHGELPE